MKQASDLFQRSLRWATGYRHSSLLILILFCSHCGSLTDSSGEGSVEKNVEVSTSATSGSATTLSIKEGSASGTEVSLPDGSLAEGAELSLDRVDAPQEFSDAVSESADAGVRTASPVISVSASKDGTSVSPEAPMTLSIPYSGLSLKLTGINQTSENLCVILKNQNNKLFIFRNKLLSIDTSARKVSFRSHYFGLYQLLYCGDTALSHFSDAGEEGASAAPPDSDSSTFSSFGKSVSYRLTIDNDSYSFSDTDHICLGILAEKSSNEDSVIVIAGDSFSVRSGSMDMDLTVNTEQIADGAEIFIALLAQAASESCNWKSGDEISGPPEFRHALFFRSSKKAIHNQDVSGNLGSNFYALTEKKVIFSAPQGSSVATASPYAIAHTCFRSSVSDSSGNNFASMYSNISVSGSAGQSISLWTPAVDSGEQGGEIYMNAGYSCQDDSPENSDEHGSLYSVWLRKAHSDGIYYLLPVSLSLSESSKQKRALLGSTGSGDICMELYPGDFTNDITSVSSSPQQALGRWALSGDSLTTYIPWDPAKTLNQNPVYDALFHVGSNCKDSFPSSLVIPENDKELPTN